MCIWYHFCTSRSYPYRLGVLHIKLAIHRRRFYHSYIRWRESDVSCLSSNRPTIELEGDCVIYVTHRKIIENLRKINAMAKSVLLFILLLFVATWLIARPAVFIIPPMDEYPAGVTLVYYDRANGAPFFASTDSYCLYSTGDVTTRCRNAALNSIDPLLQNLMATLPYSEWAYLRSTNGVMYSP